MGDNIDAETQRAIQTFLAYGSGEKLLKERLQKTIPTDGLKSFENVATQIILTVVISILVKKDTDWDSDATGERWRDFPSVHANARHLIQTIDPERGAVGADYGDPRLGNLRERLSGGQCSALKAAKFLCQYMIMDTCQQKQLIKSVLAGAEHCLSQNCWSNTRNMLDFVQMLDEYHHSKILQDLQDIQDLITQRSDEQICPDTEDHLILDMLKQLETLIEAQDSLHFVPFESNENSWRLEDARKQKGNNRERYRKRQTRKQQKMEKRKEKGNTQDKSGAGQPTGPPETTSRRTRATLQHCTSTKVY